MSDSSPISVHPYEGDTLLENALEQSREPWVVQVFEPKETCVVMGKGGRDAKEYDANTILADQVPVYRREGGGGTVVLSPGMLVVAIAAHVNQPYGNKRYFSLVQQPLVEALHDLGLPDVSQRGISDLAWRDRKILGSSLRRRRTLLMYQGVLLVDAPRDLFGQYLQHPPREPDYREGRQHHQFTINLREAGLTTSLPELREKLVTQLETRLPQLLADDLVSP